MKHQSFSDLHIEKTKLLPAIDFNTNGYMRIEGRIIPDDVGAFFRPLLDWVKRLSGKTVVLDIKVEYLNTNALVHLNRMLKILENNFSLKEVTVNWYYEEEDEEYHEKGMYIAEKLSKVKFNFLSFVEEYD